VTSGPRDFSAKCRDIEIISGYACSPFPRLLCSILAVSEPLAIVLAAGKGTRMKADLPKVLFPVCGHPRVRYVLEVVHGAGVVWVLVVAGYKADLVRCELSDEPSVAFVVHSEPLGTGHAVMVCRESLAEHGGPVLILAGDSPMASLSGSSTRKMPLPSKRHLGVDMSTYEVFQSQSLVVALEQLTTDNLQEKYYVTDSPDILKQRGKPASVACVLQPQEALSIDTLEDLAAVEAAME
jgi:bifunctional UDP-N-acetylglucosamine pyrophosphorylase/glucosamine-1-phosphate N-acetyltransferase/UDP-N-acetylglucosamine pyrophosphorylase